MKDNDFAKDRRIDPGQLDVECVRQADLFFKWSKIAIEAKSDSDRLELVKDVVKARLEARARRNPEKFKIDKITEAAIKAAVLSHSEYIAAHDDYLNAREEAAILATAATTMDQKKRMLELLVTLHGQEYFAGPKVARDLVTAYNAMGSASNARQASMTRKRARRNK